jgi:hypothetical protein
MVMRRRILLIAVAVVGVLIVLGALFGKGSPGSSGSSSGQVVFGTAIDAGAFTVASPVTSVSANQTVGWVAYLTDAVNSTKITVTLAQEPSGGGEQTVATTDVDVANPEDNELAHTPDNAISSYGPGTYTVRYVRPSDGKVLASGTITITP